ncbi:MAG: hypothetical protein PVH68_21060, partial [Armatimonadota bacterium]
MSRPTYDVTRTYEWHYEHGPICNAPPERVAPVRQERFLGYDCNSTVGVPSGPLLNSKWVRHYARLGWDIVTYKSVRSREKGCYGLPNLQFLDVDEQLAGAPSSEQVVALQGTPADPRRATWGITFGMPSRAPDEWQPDVQVAREALEEGQVLIVGVTPTPEGDWTEADVADDCALCCRLAREAGAQIIECNLSCPNVTSAESYAYTDPELSRLIAQRMRAAAPDLPLLLKMGYYDDAGTMRAVMRAVAPYVDGLTLTNGIAKTQVTREGECAYPEEFRLVSGVGGWGVRKSSLENLGRAAAIREEEGLGLEFLGCSGIMRPEDAAEYYRA